MADISVPVADLRVGHYIKLPLSWKQHPFLFSSFRIKDDAQLDIVRQIGLREIIVDPDKSTTEVIITPPPITEEEIVAPAVDPELERHKLQQQQLRRSIRNAERAYGNSVVPLRDSLSRLNINPDEGLGTVAELVRQASQYLCQQEGPVGLHLVRLPAQADSLLLHSLNVAFISMLVAREAGWPPLEIEDTGLAGLVHDIGELKIPSQILRKRTELTKAETNFLNMHVQYGFDQLGQMNAFSQRIRQAVHQHHERLDGSGYPQALQGDKIEPLARLLAVVDSYDEQLHPRHLGKAVVPNQVIAALYKRANKQLDGNFIQLLIKVMGIYPPGSLVQLSDETVALVMSSDPSAALKPCILPFQKGKVPEGVDLINLRQDDRTIARTLELDELTPPQRDFFSLGKRYCYYFSSGEQSELTAMPAE